MALRPALQLYPSRGHTRTDAPAVELISADELRAFLREDAAELPDATADLYIQQAREFLEEATGLAFINQTWQLTLDTWPGYVEPWWDGVRQMAISELTSDRGRTITLPRYPLQSLTSVTVYDETGTPTAVSIATVFLTDTQQKPGRIGLQSGQSWPSATQALNAIVISYLAGFGAAATDVPALIRGAVLDLAGYYYSHRGECDLSTAAVNSGALSKISMFTARGI